MVNKSNHVLQCTNLQITRTRKYMCCFWKLHSAQQPEITKPDIEKREKRERIREALKTKTKQTRKEMETSREEREIGVRLLSGVSSCRCGRDLPDRARHRLARWSRFPSPLPSARHRRRWTANIKTWVNALWSPIRVSISLRQSFVAVRNRVTTTNSTQFFYLFIEIKIILSFYTLKIFFVVSDLYLYKYLCNDFLYNGFLE